MAFTQNVNPTFVRQPNMGLVQITTGTGSSTLVTAYTGGSSNGSKIVGLTAVGYLTTAAFDLMFGITNGSTFHIVSTVSISAAAGSTSGTGAVNCLNVTNVPGLPLDSDGNPFFFLRTSQDLLQVKTPATSSTWVTGALFSVVAISGDF